MPFTSIPDPSIASITNAGRNALARATLGEISFKLVGFAVGRDGYQMLDPTKIIPIDQNLSSLLDQIFPTTGIQPITALEFPYPYTVVVNCRVNPTDINSALGEMGVWAEIINSTVPTEIGTQFLFAVAHFPIIVKTIKQAILYRIIIQF